MQSKFESDEIISLKAKISACPYQLDNYLNLLKEMKFSRAPPQSINEVRDNALTLFHIGKDTLFEWLEADTKNLDTLEIFISSCRLSKMVFSEVFDPTIYYQIARKQIKHLKDANQDTDGLTCLTYLKAVNEMLLLPDTFYLDTTALLVKEYINYLIELLNDVSTDNLFNIKLNATSARVNNMEDSIEESSNDSTNITDSEFIKSIIDQIIGAYKFLLQHPDKYIEDTFNNYVEFLQSIGNTMEIEDIDTGYLYDIYEELVQIKQKIELNQHKSAITSIHDLDVKHSVKFSMYEFVLEKLNYTPESFRLCIDSERKKPQENQVLALLLQKAIKRHPNEVEFFIHKMYQLKQNNYGMNLVEEVLDKCLNYDCSKSEFLYLKLWYFFLEMWFELVKTDPESTAIVYFEKINKCQSYFYKKYGANSNSFYSVFVYKTNKYLYMYNDIDSYMNMWSQLIFPRVDSSQTPIPMYWLNFYIKNLEYYSRFEDIQTMLSELVAQERYKYYDLVYLYSTAPLLQAINNETINHFLNSYDFTYDTNVSKLVSTTQTIDKHKISKTYGQKSRLGNSFNKFDAEINTNRKRTMNTSLKSDQTKPTSNKNKRLDSAIQAKKAQPQSTPKASNNSTKTSVSQLDQKLPLVKITNTTDAICDEKCKVDESGTGKISKKDNTNDSLSNSESIPQFRKVKTVFLSNLSFKVEEEDIRSHFSSCGDIFEVRLAKSRTGHSKGFAYLEFEDKKSVQSAIDMDRSLLKGRPVFVSLCMEKNESRPFPYSTDITKNTVFVSKLSKSTTTETLTEIFKQFGDIHQVRIVTNRSGQSKGYAYVEFNLEQSASRAVMSADNNEIDGNVVSVSISNPPKRNSKSTNNPATSSPEIPKTTEPKLIAVNKTNEHTVKTVNKSGNKPILVPSSIIQRRSKSRINLTQTK